MKTAVHCPLCNITIPPGPNGYGMKYARGYDLWVCRSCWSLALDGWPPRHEPFLLQHLAARGLPVPARNAIGRMPRESCAAR
jgi:hypothetical protein